MTIPPEKLAEYGLLDTWIEVREEGDVTIAMLDTAKSYAEGQECAGEGIDVLDLISYCESGNYDFGQDMETPAIKLLIKTARAHFKDLRS